MLLNAFLGKYFKLHTNCRAVKGITRSAIYDLQREKIFLIPETIFSVVRSNFRLKKNTIRKEDEDLFKLLIDNELFLIADDAALFKLFPKINLEFREPNHISNAVVFDSPTQNYEDIINKLDVLGCKNLQIVFSKHEISYVKKTLHSLKNSGVTNLEIVFTNSISLEKIKSIIDICPRLRQILVFNSKLKTHVYENVLVHISKNKCEFSSNKSKVSISNFRPNLPLFIESLQFNVYLNKKLIVDVNGSITNSFINPDFFGKIQDLENVKKVVSLNKFKKYWKISKDKIKECKDCEFRYCCVDDRIPKLNKRTKLWVFEHKCNYDPKTLQWKSQS